MESIDPLLLRHKLKAGEDYFLLDVRQPFEHEHFNIGGTLISLDEIFENVDSIPRNKPVIVYCQKGIRSQIAIQRLEQRFGFNNLINLTGGMDKWSKLP